MASRTLTFTSPGPTALTIASLTRADTGTTVSGSVAQQSSVVWLLSITEPAPGLIYAYTLTGTWADGSSSPVIGTVVATSLSGVYWTQSGTEQIYGAGNVAKWSQKDNNVDTLDTAALAAAGSRVDNYTNRRLRDFLYVAPLASSSRDFAFVQDAANELVGVYLYEARGLQDSTAGIDGKMTQHRKDAMGALKNLLTRVSGIDCPRSASPAVAVIDPRPQAAADGYPVPRVGW
jgi:hypothetical protein